MLVGQINRDSENQFFKQKHAIQMCAKKTERGHVIGWLATNQNKTLIGTVSCHVTDKAI